MSPGIQGGSSGTLSQVVSAESQWECLLSLFQGTPTLVSVMAAPSSLPTNSAGGGLRDSCKAFLLNSQGKCGLGLESIAKISKGLFILELPSNVFKVEKVPNYW